MTKPRDHGGGVDNAVRQYGGTRADWLDLSTGINPTPYPIGDISADAWNALPDHAASTRLIDAARRFWNVPQGAQIVPSPGASSLIARMPGLHTQSRRIYIPGPTYNEHAAAFYAADWQVLEQPHPDTQVQVIVHPNNPTGALTKQDKLRSHPLNIIDESFCDVTPNASIIAHSHEDDVVVLKSFGKFWGLAGLRLGFAICAPKPAQKLRDMIGPWPVAGPALEIGARALEDFAWAENTRAQLARDAARLDLIMTKAGATTLGGTSLFRLYDVGDAAAWQDKLAQSHIWSRVFPYSSSWLRLGLPAAHKWDQLEAAL